MNMMTDKAADVHVEQAWRRRWQDASPSTGDGAVLQNRLTPEHFYKEHVDPLFSKRYD